MDNSWLIEFAGQRILIDPWLKGVEVDYFPWFNTQWHRTKPLSTADIGKFDWVLITQKYPDHFHKETLLELEPEKVIVPKSIFKSLSKILPNAQIHDFNRGLSDVFGSGINLHFLPTKRKIDPIYDVLVLEDGNSSVLLATHGFSEVEEWPFYFEKLPPVKLAITPFNHYRLPVFLGGTVSPGIEAVKKMVRVVQPAKVIATHDEDKHAKGLVSKFAKVTPPPAFAEMQKDEALKDRLLEINNYEPITL